ncbi:hypothetical protein B4100_3310 [Heyndrickxia coagulans]|nr:hypothetical protein B4100_3310 [Heyndrickxia coagulans]
MLHNAGNELVCRIAQLQFCIVRVIECIFFSFKKRKIGVHPGTVHAKQRFRHKRRMQAMFACNRLDHQFKGLDIVACPDCIRIFKINFVLAGCNFMVGRFNFKAHFLEFQYDVAPAVFAKVRRRQVKIAAVVVQLQCRFIFFIQLEEEEFRFRPKIKTREAKFFHFFQYPFQIIPRITFKRGAVRIINIANQTGDFPFLSGPRENDPCIIVRIQIHIRFFNPDKPFNRRAVEHDFIVERFFKLAERDFHVFNRPQNIRELQADEFHILFFGIFQNIFTCKLRHEQYSSL